jgi:predicted AAA+ superfamily ATPase
MEIERELKLAPLLAMKSFFLFGPRATGKTTLIRRQLAETAFIIDLLDSRYFLRLSADPHSYRGHPVYFLAAISLRSVER